jgi:hypothetical protein
MAQPLSMVNTSRIQTNLERKTMLVLGGEEFLGELAGECPTDKEMAYFSEMANGEKLWYEGVSPTKAPTRRSLRTSDIKQEQLPYQEMDGLLAAVERF